MKSLLLLITAFLTSQAFAAHQLKSMPNKSVGAPKNYSVDSSEFMETFKSTIQNKGFGNLKDLQDFTLHNDSSEGVCSFYVSPTQSDSWGDDLLGDYYLPSGASADVTMSGWGDQCQFDLLAVLCDAEETEIPGWDLNLCEITDITIN